MTTPEGKVKRKVSALLKEYAPDLYYFMPVPSGLGESTLDYIGCANKHFFAIETKAHGKRPTERQQMIINMIENAGGRVFVISDDEGLRLLRHWLDATVI